MIRVLFVGKEASDWAVRLEETAGLETVTARLPAAAIRSFEQSPPDIVSFCVTTADRRLAGAVEAIRSRPLGAVTPLIAIGPREGAEEELLDAINAWHPADLDVDALIDSFAEVLDLDPTELRRPEFPMPRKSTTTPVPTAPPNDVELDAAAVEEKLRQVRHETYFAILEVEPQASAATIRDAFETVRRRFTPDRIPDELEGRFSAELDEIRDAIEDAWAVLGNETLRSRYAEAALSR